jgi:hypothetical protein
MEFHTDLDGNLILDEDGNPVEKSICICGAWEPTECACGAWDDVNLDEWYKDD